MKYPKKKENKCFCPSIAEWNQCHDEFTAYLKEALSEERIEKMILDSVNELLPNDFYEIKITKLAKALREMVGL